METSLVLEAVGISKTFHGTGSAIEVLNGVDLAVKRSEVVGIVGASGELNLRAAIHIYKCQNIAWID